MWIYFLLFFSIGIIAVMNMRPVIGNSRISIRGVRGIIWFSVLVLIIGFRHEVGGDWISYLENLDRTIGIPLYKALNVDPGYNFLNWFGANIFGGIYLVNLICAGLFSWGLLEYCKFQRRPELALLTAVPYIIIVVGFGYTRQAVGLGMGMASLVALQNGRFLRFIVFIAFGMLFHKSLIIFLPFALFYKFKNRLIVASSVLIVLLVVFLVLLQEYINGLISAYIITNYDSSGAGIRGAMNALPAIIFLVWYKRFP